MTLTQMITAAVLSAAGLVTPLASVAATGADSLSTLAPLAAPAQDAVTYDIARHGSDDRADRRREDRRENRREDRRERRHDDDRGRGYDDHGKDRNHGGATSGRDRPRIPGGSGCDDARDLIEHAECRV